MTRTIDTIDGMKVIKLFEDDKLILTIGEKLDSDPIEITLDGALTSDTAGWLLNELDFFASVNFKVRTDFSKVTYLSPSAVQAFRNNQKSIDGFRKGGLTLTNVSDELYDQMEKLGVAGLLLIED